MHGCNATKFDVRVRNIIKIFQQNISHLNDIILTRESLTQDDAELEILSDISRYGMVS